MDREDGIAPVIGTLQHRLQLDRAHALVQPGHLALELRFHARVRLRLQQVGKPPRIGGASNGVTQFLRIFTSCTTVRARSWLVQNPGSPCWDSSVLRRSRLLSRSKKTSEFVETRLQVGQAVGQVGHWIPK